MDFDSIIVDLRFKFYRGYMRNLSSLILAICVVIAMSFGAVANAATAKGGHIETDQPSLFKTGDKMAGIGFWGYWGGGIDLMGSYFFTDNIAAQLDVSPVTYTPVVGGTTASILVVDVMGVYHMAFADNMGGYFGLGLGMGSATINGITYSVSGLAYTAGVEMMFTENIRGNLGITSGGLNAGVSFLF